MNAVNDILGRVPMSQLAAELGTDEATAEQAARQAIASLVGGMKDNASDEGGAASLAGALNQHSQSRFAAADTVDLADVDTADGEKIVSHVLGSDPDTQVASLGGLLGNAQVQKLLTMLAPIVMGYLARQVTSGKFGDILGGILGGGSGAKSPDSGGLGGLGDILGGILGGGDARSASTQPSTPPADDNPFHAPNEAGGSDQLKFPTADAPTQQRAEEERETRKGGTLGDILGGILGKK